MDFAKTALRREGALDVIAARTRWNDGLSGREEEGEEERRDDQDFTDVSVRHCEGKG